MSMLIFEDPYSGKWIKTAGYVHTDDSFNPDSDNAQSGKAVAEAIAGVKDYIENYIAEALGGDY